MSRAYKRGRNTVEFEGFDLRGPPLKNSTEWLLSTAGVGDEDYYDDYDFDETVPDEWDNMDPKYVNNKQVLVNRQIE